MSIGQLFNNQARFPGKLIRGLFFVRWATIIFFVLVVALCAYPATLLGDVVATDNKAPTGSPGYVALEKFKEFYPSGATLTGFIIYMRQKKTDEEIKDAIKQDILAGMILNNLTEPPAYFTYSPTNVHSNAVLADTISDPRYNMMDFNMDYHCRFEGQKLLDEAYLARNPVPVMYYGETLYLLDALGAPSNPFSTSYPHTFFHSFSTYRAVQFASLPEPVGAQYTAHKKFTLDIPTVNGIKYTTVRVNHSAYMLMSVKPYATDGKVKEFAKNLAEVTIPKVLQMHGLSDIIEASVISAPNFYDLIGSSVGNDITRTLWIILPLTVIFFGVAIGSVRLAIIPVVVFIVAVLASMGLTYGVAFNGGMDVNSLAAGVILVFTMALTMDFNFFLTSQYKRAVNDQIRDALQEASQNGKRLFGKGAVSFRQILTERRLRLGPKDALGVPTRANATSEPTAEEQASTPENFGGFEKEDYEALTNGTYEFCIASEFDRMEIMKRMYSAAGRTICITTLIVLLSSIAMYSYDLDQIQSLGVTIFTTTLITFLTSIVLTPTMLLLWHRFFFIGAAERLTSAVTPQTVTTPAHQLTVKDKALKDELSNKKLGIILPSDIDHVRTNEHHPESAVAALEVSRTTTMESSVTSNSAAPSYAATSCTPMEDEENVCEGSAENKQEYNSGVARWTWWFGKEFAAQQLLPEKKRRLDIHTREEVLKNNDDAILDVYIRHAQTPAKVRAKLQSNFIFVYRLLTTFPQSIIAWLFGVGVLFAFFGYAVGSDAFLYSNNLKQYMPNNAAVVKGWDGFMEDYLPGSLFTYQFMQEYPSITNFTDATYGPNFFAQQQFMAQVMIERLPRTTAKSIEAVAFSGVLSDNLLSATQGNISLLDVATCAYYAQNLPTMVTPLCTYYLLLAGMFTSTDTIAPGVTYFSMPMEFDPTDQDPGEEWYRIFVNELIPYFEKTLPFVHMFTTHRDEAEAARDLYFAENGITEASQLPPYYRVKLYLKGYPGENFETIQYAKKSLGTICGITIAIIFVVVLLSFNSIVTALRVTFTVTLIVASCYCMTALTYSSRGLDRMRISAFQGPGASLLWMVPFIILLCSVAVVLNYELITTTKAIELRWGFSTNALRSKKVISTQAAIERAFAVTAREVYSSGFMVMFMFVGIGSLSQVSAMNQVGFLMVVAAFFSAFFARTFISPTLMHLLGEYNWFPLNCLPTNSTLAPPTVNSQPSDLLCVAHNVAAKSTGETTETKEAQKETERIRKQQLQEENLRHQNENGDFKQAAEQFDYVIKEDEVVVDADTNHNTAINEGVFEMPEK